MLRSGTRLNPAFVEWLMGFPRGWTEGYSRNVRLHMLGNAAVPAGAALAWRELSAALERGTRAREEKSSTESALSESEITIRSI
jgi:hypothetical protein